MQIKCEYCDSYVEVDDNLVCPNCGAPLGDAVKAAKEEAAQEAQAAAEAQAATEAEEQKQKNVSNIVGLVGSALLGGMLSGNRRSSIGGSVTRSSRPMGGPGGPMGGPGGGHGGQGGFGGGHGGQGGFGGGHGGPGGHGGGPGGHGGPGGRR